ncbi:MAG: hypothetical protein JSU87_12700 [Gemmatimonadota bacterium]|nr:MAG: hypothetical protein JSU87_12700 [Gemmatimonadota bacterium]
MITSEHGSSVVAGILATTLALSACGERSAERSRAVRADSRGAAALDSVVVLATRWLVAPSPEQEPPLAAPVGLAVDDERGRVYVLELTPPELRLYDADDGRFLGALGREGDGPGEYRHPIGMALNGGGTAAVLAVSGRVTFWDSGSELLGIATAGPGLATDIVPARGDSFYVKTELFAPEDVAEFRIVHPGLAMARTRFSDAEVTGLEEPGRDSRNHSYPIAATMSGGLLIAPPGPDYRIIGFSPEGVVAGTARRQEVEPLERDAKEIEAIRTRIRNAFATAGRPAPKDIPVPMYRAHIARLCVAGDGTIWALTQRGSGEISMIDRFDEHGRFQGSLRVGLRISELFVTSSHIYLLARSELDVPGIAIGLRPDTKS